MIQEDLTNQVNYLVLEGERATTRALVQAIERNMRNAVHHLNNQGGEVTLKTLKKSSNQIRVMQSEDDMKDFHKYCKRYGVRYAITPDPSNESRNLILFEAKNEELISQCLKEFFKDYNKELDPQTLESSTLEEVVTKNPEELKTGDKQLHDSEDSLVEEVENKIFEKPQTKKDTGKETKSINGPITPSLNEKLDKYLMENKEKDRKINRSIPDRGGR